MESSKRVFIEHRVAHHFGIDFVRAFVSANDVGRETFKIFIFPLTTDQGPDRKPFAVKGDVDQFLLDVSCAEFVKHIGSQWGT